MKLPLSLQQHPCAWRLSSDEMARHLLNHSHSWEEHAKAFSTARHTHHVSKWKALFKDPKDAVKPTAWGLTVGRAVTLGVDGYRSGLTDSMWVEMLIASLKRPVLFATDRRICS